MNDNATIANQAEEQSTSFGYETALSGRIRRALEGNVDLAKWNSDYSHMEEFFGDTITFSDFSLSNGWGGEILIYSDQLDTPYLLNNKSSIASEVLLITSEYTLRVLKKYWKKLAVHIDLINDKLSYLDGSYFRQNPDTGAIKLTTRFIKPASPISDAELLYFLIMHKTISHRFFGEIDNICNGKS